MNHPRIDNSNLSPDSSQRNANRCSLADIGWLAFDKYLDHVSSSLVNSYKSHRKKAFEKNLHGFQVYKESVKVIKKTKIKKSGSSGGVRQAINSFTWKARKNLEFKVKNSAYEFVSQFGLTYHNNCPSDGRIVKNHLDSFLKRLRYKYPFIRYTWILEFQSRGVPHYHVYLNVPVENGLHKYMAHAWNRITSESASHLRFHLHGSNFVPWEMNSSYLTKYLTKEYQKHVPEEYLNVGRFWGTSRGIVTDPVEFTRQMFGVMYEPFINSDTGEYHDPKRNWHYVYRCLRKYHEKKVRLASKLYGKPRKYKSGITKQSSYLMMGGASIIKQVREYLHGLYHVPF